MVKASFKLLLACWLLAGWTGAARAAGELVFGVFPYLSASQTVEQYAPLKEHLGKALGTSVTLRSAPDYARFIERTQNGEYDIIFTAPHMGRLAERRDGYRRLAQTGYAIVVVVLARKDGPVQSLADLKGRSLAVGAKLSMSYQITDQALGKLGLALGRDVKFINTASFSNVPEALIRGEADAGSTGTLLWDTAPADQREALREIHRAAPVPGFLVLAH
jgi:phosphonate transport system substrate-binding protein